MKTDRKKSHVIRELFCATFYLSMFTFGGGYVIVTLLKNKFVDEYHWIEDEEMLDLVAIAQSSPGAIAVNGAIVVGYKLAGIPGVIVSVFGAVIPPMLILSFVSLFYEWFRTNPYISAMLNGMKAGIGAVITSVVYDMGKSIVSSRDWVNAAVMIISFIVSYFLKVNVIMILLVTALLGILRTLYSRRREKSK